VLVVVILLVAGVFSGSSRHTAQPSPTSNPSSAPAPAAGGGRRAGSRFAVAVLNGTTVPGLARRVADRIAHSGFRVRTVTNATSQQHRTTVVSYGPGRHAQAAAVAAAINVGSGALAPLDASSRVVARGAPVVVTVGADASR
jgi:hypothetical protein